MPEGVGDGTGEGADVGIEVGVFAAAGTPVGCGALVADTAAWLIVAAGMAVAPAASVGTRSA
jgi:hypothetical protein